MVVEVVDIEEDDVVWRNERESAQRNEKGGKWMRCSDDDSDKQDECTKNDGIEITQTQEQS